MTEREALKLALEALKQMKAQANFDCWNLDICDEAITAAEKALAQPEQPDLDAICQDLQEKTYNQAMRIAELEAQLAQPEQEPVASIFISGIGEREFDDWGHDLPVGRNLLYAIPPQRKPWVSLTPTHQLMCWSRATHDADVEHKTEHQCLMDYGSEIEAKLRELNEAPQRKPLTDELHCKAKRENNGICPHHNLQCGWPKCNEAAHGIKE